MTRRFLVLAFAVWILSYTAPEPAQGQGSGSGSAEETYKNVYNGWRWWHVYCYRCHGMDAVGSTNAPGFIDPNSKLTRTEFLRKVRNGVPETAMQAWNKLLDDNQIGQLYMYVSARNDKVLPAGRPDEIGPNGGRWIPPKGWPAAK